MHVKANVHANISLYLFLDHYGAVHPELKECQAAGEFWHYG